MSEPISVEEFTRVESIFVRHRNVLAVRAQFTPIYTDYYLHLMQYGLRNPEELDSMLKDLLAGLTLHLVARPWAETIAWTVNLRAPRVNLFATGGSIPESITGRLFTEDVRETDRDLFYSQTTTQPGAEPRTSTLQIDGRDPLFWVEQYYMQSEQRPAKVFRLPDETFVLVAAQPDYDEEWFGALDVAAVSGLEQAEETKLLETRRFRFHCGCDLGKILPVLAPWRDKADELFHGENQIIVQCPRCAARYEVTRDML
ncbi:disulfide bond chaperone [Haloferula sargassicola]|uniref:Disulfide bond chaperone n=1 Tax=Haloferula sargassicola TaxID=490096 RepID=A0ABP9UPB2_9BACT